MAARSVHAKGRAATAALFTQLAPRFGEARRVPGVIEEIRSSSKQASKSA